MFPIGVFPNGAGNAKTPGPFGPGAMLLSASGLAARHLSQGGEFLGEDFNGKRPLLSGAGAWSLSAFGLAAKRLLRG